MSESYSVLLPYKDTQSEDNLTYQDEKEQIRSPSSNKKKYCVSILLALSIILNIGFIFNLLRSSKQLGVTKEQLNGPLHFSPIIQDIDMSLQTKHFNGTFNPTKYTQDPSPDVDEAWKQTSLEEAFFQLSLEEGKKYGLQKGHHVRVAPEVGDGFIVGLEGSHHLHCLDLLRKVAFFNYEYYQSRKIMPFKVDLDGTKGHFRHCLEILREQLTCQPNLNIYGQVWLQSTKDKPINAFLDFNTEQKCRRWEGVREWLSQRKFPEEKTWVQFREGDHISLNKIP